MYSLKKWMILFIVCFILSSGNCQSLSIEVEPEAFLPPITPTISIRCSVKPDSIESPMNPILVLRIIRSQLGSDYEQKPLETDNSGKKMTQLQIINRSKPVLEELIATLTPGGHMPTLHIKDPDGRFSVDGSISTDEAENCSLTLRVTSPKNRDAGLYVCAATLLDSTFHIRDVTAMANISVMGDRDSPAMLLAKELILEEQQKHFQEEEISFQVGLDQVRVTNAQLSENLHDMQEATKNLTLWFNDLAASLLHLNKKLEDLAQSQLNMDDSKAAAELKTITNDSQLATIQQQLQHLESVVVSDLQKRINSVEKDALVNLERRLQMLEVNISTEVRRHTLNNIADDTANVIMSRLDEVENTQLPILMDKVDNLERDTLPQLGQRLTRLENVSDMEVDLDDLNTRINKIEWTMKNSQEQSENLGIKEGPAHDFQILHRTEVSSESRSPRLCYICGSLAQHPCTVTELTALEPHQCDEGEMFCINDIYQKDGIRSIYKRCANEAVCRSVHNADSATCVNFNFMSGGNLDCHYCCTKDGCNYDIKPLNNLIQI